MDPQVSIGETLRRRREERGLNAEQAAFQSKVPLRLVQVLESDDYHLLPDPLYLVRFVHDYATFLGADGAALAVEFQRAIQRPPRPPLVEPAVPRPTPTIRWRQVWWTVAAILVVTPPVLIALSLASKRAADPLIQTRAAEPKAEAPVRTTGGADSKPPGPDGAVPSGWRPPSVVPDAPATAVVATPEPPAVHGQRADLAAVSAGHVLIVRAQEPTWLSVRSDQKDPREVLLQPGQVARFEAQAGFRVIVGNAGGVTLSLDGALLPSLGRSGEVVRDLALPQVPRDSPGVGAALAVPAR